MATSNEPDDIDALLAEVDRSLSPTAGAAPAKRAPSTVSSARKPASGDSAASVLDRIRQRLLVSLIVGGVCAGIVFALFFLTPLTGAISGALGAGLAGFATALLLPRRL